MSKALKESTRKLTRQLKDNPEVKDDQILIYGYKSQLTNHISQLMEEMAEGQTFATFKNRIDRDLEE